MKISNQKPVVLCTASWAEAPTQDFDLHAHFAKGFAAPFFEPAVPGAKTAITSNGKPVDVDDVAELAAAATMSETIDPAVETTLKSLLSASMVHYDANPSMTADSAYLVQAAVSQNMDLPDANTIYTPATDVIPAAKDVLLGNADVDVFFASIGFTYRPATLGIAFAAEVVFDGFKRYVASEVAAWPNPLPADTQNLFAQFDKLSLKGLTESIALRKGPGDANEPESFARILVRLAHNFASTTTPEQCSLMPFSVAQMAVPESVVFVNIDAHAHASASQVNAEWQDISAALGNPMKVMSTRNITRLTALQKSASKMASMAATAASNAASAVGRHASVPFRKTAPTQVDFARMVAKLLRKMNKVNFSQNSMKDVKRSFMRPSRRDPDNYNLAGKAVSTTYYPDIHLYVDTSGSISERHYQDAVKACIAMARKLDVNLYFNSFSNVLSDSTFLPVKGRSTAQIYEQFRRVPKVDGGTDYTNIWRYVSMSKKRRKELSLVITDFEFYPPRDYVEHPANIYYAPCSNLDWDSIVYWADEFAQGMAHIDPNIRAKILC